MSADFLASQLDVKWNFRCRVERLWKSRLLSLSRRHAVAAKTASFGEEAFEKGSAKKEAREELWRRLTEFALAVRAEYSRSGGAGPLQPFSMERSVDGNTALARLNSFIRRGGRIPLDAFHIEPEFGEGESNWCVQFMRDGRGVEVALTVADREVSTLALTSFLAEISMENAAPFGRMAAELSQNFGGWLAEIRRNAAKTEKVRQIEAVGIEAVLKSFLSERNLEGEVSTFSATCVVLRAAVSPLRKAVLTVNPCEFRGDVSELSRALGAAISLNAEMPPLKIEFDRKRGIRAWRSDGDPDVPGSAELSALSGRGFHAELV